MSTERPRGTAGWLLEKLADAIVYLLDLLIRVWKPKLKVRK